MRGSTEKSARRCAVKDCPSLCHRGQKCSRISKYCRDGVWKCLAHSGRRRSQGSQSTPQGTQQVVETVQCANKSCKVKKIYPHIFKYVCGNCKGNFHGNCTDMMQVVRAKVQKDPVTNIWTCPMCVKKLAQSPPKKLVFSEEVDDISTKMVTQE